MTLKDFIPGLGDRTTAKRIRDLEKKAGTLPVIFALLFTESIKSAIANLQIYLPNPIKFFIASIIVAIFYIYEDERKNVAKKGKEKASGAKDTVKEKASEATDKAKEKASGDSDKD
jgi:hypothetical protein